MKTFDLLWIHEWHYEEKDLIFLMFPNFHYN